MGDGDRLRAASRQLTAAREKDLTRVYAVMACLVGLILLQFLLLMVAIEGYLGGEGAVILPSAAGSGVCFLGACVLIRGLARPGAAAPR